jgi:hypothetical protein
MKSNSEPGKPMRRRDLLASVAAAGTVLGFDGIVRGQTAGNKAGPSSPLSEGLAPLARLRDYEDHRSSSYDKSGGNADFISIESGETATLQDISGPGISTHIWFTINSNENNHLKKLVLQAYWDGETEPSVQVPVGDFFGLGLGEYFLYQSALTSVASVKALNAYFPMPFAKVCAHNRDK